MTTRPSKSELAAELEELRTRLAEAEEALRAIRGGEVDAVVVAGERGEQVYTLRGADRIYRQLIETMSEGAAIVSADGSILYCNVRLAEMLGRPFDRVVGTALRNYLPPADQQAVDAILAQGRTEPSRREINLKTSEGGLVPVYLSASRLQSEGAEVVFCLVLTDLTEQKSHEQILAAERLARSILEQAAEAIVVCDEQGRVVRASQAVERLCDGSPLRRPFAEVFPLRTDAADPFHLAPVLQGETLRNVDVVLDRRGQEFHLILNAGPLLSDQQIVGCVVTLTDITERRRSEEALAESRRELEATFDAAADGILLAETESGRFQSANASICRMLGYSRDEMLDLGVSDIFRKEDLAHAVQEFKRHAKEDSASSASLRLKRKDGSVFFADINSTAVTLGSKRFLVGMFRDITERKRAEEAGERREADLQESQRIAGIGSWERTIATGVVTWSEGMNHVLGRNRGLSAPTFETLASFYTPESWERLGAVIARTIETGAPYELELEMVRADGTTCWTTTRGEAIREADGTVVKLRGTAHDITQRKRATETEARLVAILEATPDLVAIADPEGWFVDMNRAGRKMLGIDESTDLAKHNLREFHDAANAHVVLTEGIPTAIREGAWSGETELVALDGHAIVVSQVILAHKAPNGTLAFLSTIARDITERKRAEEEVKSQLKELTRWQDVMLGREDRVQELKREVNELSRRLAEPIRYPSQEVGPADPKAVEPNA